MLRLFAEAMGDDSFNIQTFVGDAMPAQIKAVQYVFNCDYILCQFHVLQAAIRRVSSNYYLYSQATSIINDDSFSGALEHNRS